jgi:hypothetical protein
MTAKFTLLFMIVESDKPVMHGCKASHFGLNRIERQSISFVNGHLSYFDRFFLSCLFNEDSPSG